MIIWEIETAPAESDEMETLLANGWEPFAVTREELYVDPFQSERVTMYHLRRPK